MNCFLFISFSMDNRQLRIIYITYQSNFLPSFNVSQISNTITLRNLPVTLNFVSIMHKIQKTNKPFFISLSLSEA